MGTNFGVQRFVQGGEMEKEYLLFDLDGTLTDPKEGITKSVRHALNAFDIEVEDLDTLCWRVIILP